MSDSTLIKPGCWVETVWGRAVCVSVEAHKHRNCPDDSCKDALYVAYRYKAFRPKYKEDGTRDGYMKNPIWVLNGDITEGSHAVKFLRTATRLSLRVLKLKGPYGEGN